MAKKQTNPKTKDKLRWNATNIGRGSEGKVCVGRPTSDLLSCTYSKIKDWCRVKWKACHAAISVYLVAGEGRALGSSVQKSCRAECSNNDWPQAAALHSAAAASKIPLGNPKGRRAQGQYFQESVPPRLAPPFACVDSGAAQVSSTLGEAAGNPDVALAAPETTSRCAGRPAGMGLTSSGTLVPESARKPRQKQGCSGGKDQRPRKSKCLEGEFLR